jgi:Holliday junction resolvasome RuvABC DNA-binding subunit
MSITILETHTYGNLRGTVERITPSADESGDVEVVLQVNTTSYTVTIPQFYISNFDAASQTVTFVQLPNFESVNYSLTPNDQEQRTFYGLRNWKFGQSTVVPTMARVEMIEL